MKELTLFIVKSLVDRPDEAAVVSHEDDGALELSIRVADDDKGKVIGKQGKVIKAIRAVVGAAALKHQLRVALDIE